MKTLVSEYFRGNEKFQPRWEFWSVLMGSWFREIHDNTPIRDKWESDDGVHQYLCHKVDTKTTGETKCIHMHTTYNINEF